MNKNIKEISFRSDCAISSALDIIGDKWSLLILRDIMFSEKRTYSEFAASIEKIATNILSDRLVHLEKAGIIHKGKLPDNKKTNIYSLTRRGLSFLPVMIEVMLWSDQNLHDHIPESTKRLAIKIRQNKTAFTKALYVKLEKGIVE